MTTRFQDGPAKGKVLSLSRSPLFLRVVICKSNGDVDALDKTSDTPRDDESIHVYILASRDGGAFIDYTDKTTGKRRGRFIESVTYRLFDQQPADIEIRMQADWEKWCQEHVPLPEEEKGI